MSLVSVPLKTILSWWADIQNDVPPFEYGICDGRTLNSSQQDINPGGNYTLPDLRNQFLLGADLTKVAGAAGTAADGAANAPGPKGTGGTHAATISIGNLPPHNHGGGDHTHPYVAPAAPQSAYAPGASNAVQSTGGGTTSASGPTIATQGSGTAHENRPSHTGVIYIMKVKF